MKKVNRTIAGLAMLLAVSGCSSIIAVSTDSPIQEDHGSRTWGSIIDDQSIETTATVNIDKAFAGKAEANFTVTSYNGIILLVGQVPNAEMKSTAEATVKRLRKVRTVYNELTIAGPISLPARSNDSWITTKAKSKLLATEGVPSGRIKILTENGVIYMLGLLTRAEAKTSVDAIANTYGAQRIVQVFEYID
ncbi:osmotically-inducible protein OsmY [Sinobacterium caligoides]|uniref:Osmotically-inducible protein OsmY n=1 Tax=Sinobacterium caligoides TaxID=933926 RepID=A0A3N2D4R7_9GAMM|nr:BON domain-containing protein [Sinobacterium caligoides]ROR94796.1 osmotically-inducible protein OsmY [Sinobacterium caligoides]